MNQNVSQIELESILLSIKTIECKENIFNKLKDSLLLDEDEIKLLNEYNRLSDDSQGIPKPGVLSTANPQYSGKPIITNEEDLIQYVDIFLRNRLKESVAKNIMNSVVNLKQSDLVTEDIANTIENEIAKLRITSEIIEKVPSLDQFKELYDNTDTNVYIKTGLEPIDKVSNGIPLGSVTIIMGGTGSFKTMTTTNISYNAMIKGFNICYISLEIPKYHMYSNIISRHSMSGKFNRPIKYRDIREKKLNGEAEKLLEDIIEDIKNLDSKFVVLDETDFKSYDISGFETRLLQVDRDFKEETSRGIDVLVVDHAQLLKFSGNNKMDPYAVVNYYVSWLRQMSLNFLRQGRKIAVIIVSQTSRGGTEYAAKHGGQFLITHAAEANEIERSASMMISVFANDMSRESNEILVQLLKSRNSETMPEPQTVKINPQYYMVGSGVNINQNINLSESFNNSIENALKEEDINLEDIFG